MVRALFTRKPATTFPNPAEIGTPSASAAWTACAPKRESQRPTFHQRRLPAGHESQRRNFPRTAQSADRRGNRRHRRIDHEPRTVGKPLTRTGNPTIRCNRAATRATASTPITSKAASVWCCRINPKIPGNRQVGLPPKLKDLALTPRGMLILAGPTGSGSPPPWHRCWTTATTKCPAIVTIEDRLNMSTKPRRCIFTQRGKSASIRPTGKSPCKRDAPKSAGRRLYRRGAQRKQYGIRHAACPNRPPVRLHHPRQQCGATIRRITNSYSETAPPGC